MNSKFFSLAITAAQKTAPALLLCGGALVSNMAHAGWIADFLCWSDNSPAQCRRHLPDILLLNKQPAPGNTTEPTKIPVNEKTAQHKQVVIPANCKGGVNVWAGPEGKGGCTPGLPGLHK